MTNRMFIDPTTFGGFVGHLVCGFIFGLSYLILTVAVASNYLSMGIYLRASYEHYEAMFRNINGMVEENVNPSQLKASLIEAINFHNTAKE